MDISKRQKALEEAEFQMEILWLAERSKKTPPPRPGTRHELDQMDQVKKLLNKLLSGQTQDINSVFETLRFSNFFLAESSRILDLQRRASLHKELKQDATKEKLWKQIHAISPV